MSLTLPNDLTATIAAYAIPVEGLRDTPRLTAQEGGGWTAHVGGHHIVTASFEDAVAVTTELIPLAVEVERSQLERARAGEAFGKAAARLQGEHEGRRGRGA